MSSTAETSSPQQQQQQQTDSPQQYNNNEQYYYDETSQAPATEPDYSNANYSSSYGYNLDDQQLSDSQNSVSSSYSGSGGEDDTYNIFVGDLRVDVTEQDLREAFAPCGEVASVHIFKDPQTQEQKGFGFVHFKTREGQQKALSDEYSRVMIKGRPCRVNASEQKNTLFLGNLPIDFNQDQIKDAVENILGAPLPPSSLELKTGPPPAYESRGFCFVQFANHSRADAARKVLQVSSIKGRPLNVSWAESKVYRAVIDEEIMAKVKTLFVSNIAVTVNEQVLVALFTEHGTVNNCAIVKHPVTRQSRGFAFIEMDTRENAEKALKSLDGSELVGQKLSVVLAKPPPHKLARERGERGGRGGGRGGQFYPRDGGPRNFSPRGPPQYGFQQSPYGMNQGSPHRGVYRAHSAPPPPRDGGPYGSMQQPYPQQQPYHQGPPRGRGGGGDGGGGGRGGKFRGGRGGGFQQSSYGQQQTPYGSQAPYQQQATRYSPYSQSRQPYQPPQATAYPATGYQAQVGTQQLNPYLYAQTAEQTAQFYQQYQMDPSQQQQYYQQQQQYYQQQGQPFKY